MKVGRPFSIVLANFFVCSEPQGGEREGHSTFVCSHCLKVKKRKALWSLPLS